MNLLKCCWIRKPLNNYNWIDLLWFNFIESSKRYISLENAINIKTPFSTLRVWIFWKLNENKIWKKINRNDLVDIIMVCKNAKINAIQIYWECDFWYLKMFNFLTFSAIKLNDLDNIKEDNNIDFYIIDWKNPWSWEEYNYEKINNYKINKKFLIAWWIKQENILDIYKIFKNNLNFCWVDIATWVDNWENIDRNKIDKIRKIVAPFSY